MRHFVVQILATAAAPSAPSALVIVLWTGLAVLTVALLVLMRTRWGQAKPLSKCAVLSLFAHVLFFAYAYGTRLIFDSPDPHHESIIRLSIHSGGDSSLLSAPPQTDAKTPSEPVIVPDLLLPPETVAEPAPAHAPPEALPPAPAPELIAAPREVPDDLLESLPKEVQEPPREPEPVAAPPAPPSPDLSSQLVAVSPAEPPTQAQESAPQTTSPPDAAQQLSDTNLTPVAPRSADVPPPSSKSLFSRELPATPRETSVSTIVPRTKPLTPRREGDHKPLPHIYRLRVAEDRQRWLELNGGNPETERAVEAALQWLASVQESDGRWDADRFGAGHGTRARRSRSGNKSARA